MNQNFVGSEKVGQFPKGATMQLDVNKLEQAEQDRLAKGAENPGAAKRAAVANRNPAEFDAKTGGGHGDTKPTQDPVM